MKISNLWAAAVAILTFASCGSDLESADTYKTEQATKQVYANLTMHQEDENLRVLFDVNSSAAGAVTGVHLAEGKNLNIRVAVKQGTSGTPVIQNLVFTRTGKNTATYSGQITVPNGQGNYQIGAVLMGEVGGKTFATDDFFVGQYSVAMGAYNTLAVANSASRVDVNVPYIANWVNTSLNSTGTVLETTTLSFKPQGTLLRLQFKNTTAQEQKISEVLFGNARFSNSVFINFQEATLRANPYGRMHIGMELPSQLTLPAQQSSGWYYMWVMPHDVNDTTRPIMAFTRETLDVAFTTRVLSTTQALADGKSMSVVLSLGSDAVSGAVDASWYAWTAAAPSGTPRVSLSYLSDKVVNQAGTAFVSDYKTNNTGVGLFTQSQAIAKFGNPITIATKRYSLPTYNELKAIIPAYNSINNVIIFPVDWAKNRNMYNVAEEDVKIGTLTKNYLADYVNTGSGISYAVRFKDDKNYNRTAFRYQYVANATNNLTHLKVTARYLGASSSATIANVATEAFWSSNNTADVVRTIPFYGFLRQVATSTDGINSEFRCWTRDTYNAQTAIIMRVGATDAGTGIGSAYPHVYCPVFLMER